MFIAPNRQGGDRAFQDPIRLCFGTQSQVVRCPTEAGYEGGVTAARFFGRSRKSDVCLVEPLTWHSPSGLNGTGITDTSDVPQPRLESA